MPDASVITNLDFECLPSVIAIPLPDLARETHPVIQLWRVCDTYEQILRPVVAIGAAELDTRGGLSTRSRMESQRASSVRPAYSGRIRSRFPAIRSRVLVDPIAARRWVDKRC